MVRRVEALERLTTVAVFGAGLIDTVAVELAPPMTVDGLSAIESEFGSAAVGAATMAPVVVQ
jgi:hypothetical protein